MVLIEATHAQVHPTMLHSHPVLLLYELSHLLCLPCLVSGAKSVVIVCPPLVSVIATGGIVVLAVAIASVKVSFSD